MATSAMVRVRVRLLTAVHIHRMLTVFCLYDTGYRLLYLPCLPQATTGDSCAGMISYTVLVYKFTSYQVT